jgi:hypothetical protein
VGNDFWQLREEVERLVEDGFRETEATILEKQRQISAAPFPLDRLKLAADGRWNTTAPMPKPDTSTTLPSGNSPTLSPDDADAEQWWKIANEVQQRTEEATNGRTICDIWGCEWKEYRGFNEDYSYCLRCDKKKSL